MAFDRQIRPRRTSGGIAVAAPWSKPHFVQSRDTIQFIRYAAVLKRVAAEVIVWAQLSLIPLLQTVGGIDQLLPLHNGVPDAEYDVGLEITELPYVFRTTIENIPAGVPYVHVEPAWLKHDERLKVGLI